MLASDPLQMNENAILAVAASLFVSGAIYNFRAALDDVRHRLPKVLQDPISAVFAMDEFVSESQILLPAHRKYAASLLCFTAMALCLAILTFHAGKVPAAVIVSSVCVYGLSKTVKLWWRIKHLCRP